MLSLKCLGGVRGFGVAATKKLSKRSKAEQTRLWLRINQNKLLIQLISKQGSCIVMMYVLCLFYLTVFAVLDRW